MARYGLSIRKRVAYRGGTQHFGNTYYYEAAVPNTATGQLDDLVNKVVAIEKTIHSTDVTFDHARLWSADGTKAQNTMIVDKALTGTGSVTADTIVDRERAVLIQWSAGFDSRGRPVKLRKWFHICGFIGNSVIPVGAEAQTAPISDTQIAFLDGKAAELRNVTGTLGEAWVLVAKSGRQTTAAGKGYKWLEHHQLGQEWRG